ncbi:L-threonylcarbamoyladenylate synthase [Mameliella sp. AT18]|uniref:L-threonylcarbamoyladenylate synthase n=1 Tax=Mameliella sp. AT18 TaxID=3028385 RepID=UPI0008411BA5|nr:L-threonylcarbamoyladenylate synthase [Mameliella sp. AT18]MDD9730084.1 L-threonylcarbamoyladenylate synthase [Mameliella sp. AT18]ODM49366.1 threonylcarbamoyl-AMP synthase [Ruegeria sp. PBVC088]
MPALRLSASTQDLTRAARILAEGGLVAFPTETVYGLGADARQDHAVARIYKAKERPEFNPLIVHVADLDAAKDLVIWSEAAQALADAFWPGPLTLVLPLREGAHVSRLVTAGLDSLAVRIPAAPVAQNLLRAFGGPVAAPSANRSGQISPTRAAHVLDGLGGRIEAVVDGGPCAVGLESTILGLTGTPPTLLRPGGITEEALSAVLDTRIALRRETDGITAPGQTRSHYAPRARVRLNAVDFEPGEARLGFGTVPCDLNLSPGEDLTEAAANLFEYLHRLDATGAATIAISPIPHLGLGIAINDRLSRAAAER